MTWLLVAVVTVAALVIGTWSAFRLSPWPLVLLIRHLPALSGEALNDRLAGLVPDGVASVVDERYDDADRDAYLDVFRPAGSAALPTIVWVHGGAFIAGTRLDIRNYLRILADRGFTTVGVEYSHAPERRYPTPILQVTAALRYLQQHADRLGVDPDRIVLAGDSAGAQIAGQTALALCDREFAAKAGLPLVPPAVRIRATVLACGPYDLHLPDYQGQYGRFLRAIMWAYTGTKDFESDPRVACASLPQHVSAHFPPTFLTVGNGDPLRRHSVALAEALRAAGAPVDTLFYPDDHTPLLDHEYQLDVTTEAGAAALERIVAHVDAYTSAERPVRPSGPSRRGAARD
ncbi:alpha/beta hydrolase [Cryptosporangium minutisporangium]|uniref:Alpha/beta hydrolase n=1 Tax=Cryptosporangium minutisporangium TaxID=113569 RepID=A0ABP6SNX2_9ACTN